MPPFPTEEVAPAAAPINSSPTYTILKQQVDLGVDFANRSLKGSTELIVQPLVKELREIRLHCRQCRPTAMQVGGITTKWEYDDPYRKAQMPEGSEVRQHEMLKQKIEPSLRPDPQAELTVILPSKLKIQQLQLDGGNVVPASSNGTSTLQAQESEATALAAIETQTPLLPQSQQQGPQFAPIKLTIEFEVTNFRDGIHWVGHSEADRRFPCMYTKLEPGPGNSSCIFPCVDDATSRCSWDISVRCARTLGDAFRTPKQLQEENGVDGIEEAKTPDGTDYLIDLSDEEAAMELKVICVGELQDDTLDPEDETHHTVSFSLTQPSIARHIGFAIGPFEYVDLASTRDSEEEERLGQSAIKIAGYCFPGKRKELLNTCYPIAWAMDHMGVKYGSFPFASYQMIFVDDVIYDTCPAAGLSICSSTLLFPNTVIEPLYPNTRILVRTLADQWSGVNVIPHEPGDTWVVAGIAGFMTDAYMKDLAGNNEFRWQQKLAAEKVYDLDVDRPSLRVLGELMHLDPSIRNFVDLKSALVLFILDRRLMKASGSTGVQRIINKLFLNAKTGSLINGAVSSLDFQRTCERLGHNKLDPFFRQWVYPGSGVPIFYVTQRFNKKKLVVEMTIVQRQLERTTKPAFEPKSFMREVKEHVDEVWAPETNPVFTGPMTIRIHEADGTPYEHIVEIKEVITRLEIPYNTKYKRLKRSRRQRERAQQAQQAAGGNAAANGDGEAGATGDDGALLYCLGDILDTEDDKREWDLADWSPEDEDRMGQESYEWIRMDADFEWIGKIHLVMPLYMYISQLQQDRDIVAQYESMRYLLGSNPHQVSLSILVRTLMDSRYFWGIRSLAAEGLAVMAKDKWKDVGAFHLVKAFKELYCIHGTNFPRSNDFSDRRNFVIQCAIPKAMARLRDAEGKVPMSVRQFFVDLLKFNDNSNNTIVDAVGEEEEGLLYSDNHYIATLTSCLADALIASHREPKPHEPTYTFSFGEEEPEDVSMDLHPENTEDAEFEKLAIAQIERHRRTDEWDPSYQNIYSITALDCLQRLTKAGIVKDRSQEVMKYVRSGNAENVRLAAWRCLAEMGVLRKMAAMKFLLHCFAEEGSPRFRAGLLEVLGEALGHIALGEPEKENVARMPDATEAGGLVLEQEVSNEARRIEMTRKTTPEGALMALKAALMNEEVFKQAVWYAATSPDLMLEEIGQLCDIAGLIYEPQESHWIHLKLPRMWRCENVGSGRVKFVSQGAARREPRKGLELKDWEAMEKAGLKYSGPLSELVQKRQQQQQHEKVAALKLKVAAAERAQQQQALESASPAIAGAGDMPPPPLSTTPTVQTSVERTQSFKLNLGNKRKSSVDLGGPRAGSPKSQKISRQQSPAGSNGIQVNARGKGSPARAKGSPAQGKGSPAGTQHRSSTPASVSKQGNLKGSKIVILRLGQDNAARAREILGGRVATATQTQSMEPESAPSAHAPAAFPSGLAVGVQSPTASTSMNFFSSAPSTNVNAFASGAGGDSLQSMNMSMNIGGFRSYEPEATLTPNEGEVNGLSAEVAPSMDVAASPNTAASSGVVNENDNTAEPSGDVGEEVPSEVKEDMPPPPPSRKPKLTLKLGSRKASASQGSPE